eukprot:TRINITY_DN1441_c3_g1_i3.p1 TRINITY_DN1441_c3_g1~~TRINITY_DN1441_c3_g1_i3.p1  ORF type:complete len:884 (-),score=376.22 TRINITY_DN1441_c3_g1_i3:3591-6026(-)
MSQVQKMLQDDADDDVELTEADMQDPGLLNELDAILSGKDTTSIANSHKRNNPERELLELLGGGDGGSSTSSGDVDDPLLQEFAQQHGISLGENEGKNSADGNRQHLERVVSLETRSKTAKMGALKYKKQGDKASAINLLKQSKILQREANDIRELLEASGIQVDLELAKLSNNNSNNTTTTTSTSSTVRVISVPDAGLSADEALNKARNLVFEYKQGALHARDAENIGYAKGLLIVARTIEKQIQQYEEQGTPIDVANLPPPVSSLSSVNALMGVNVDGVNPQPKQKQQQDQTQNHNQNQNQTEGDEDIDDEYESENKEISGVMDVHMAEQTAIYDMLESTLRAQIKTAMKRAEIARKAADMDLVDKFEREQGSMRRDLESLLSAKYHRSVPPKFHYESRKQRQVISLADVGESEMELNIVGASNIRPPSGYESLDLYVTYNLAYPSADDGAQGQTGVCKSTLNPEWNFCESVPIDRKKKSFVRFCERKKMSFVLMHSRFLFADVEVGRAELPLKNLVNKTKVHVRIEVLDGRKKTGGKLEIKLRLRDPLGGKQIDEVQEKYLIIDDYNPDTMQSVPSGSNGDGLTGKQQSSTSSSSSSSSSDSASSKSENTSNQTVLDPSDLINILSNDVMKYEINKFEEAQSQYEAQGRKVPRQLEVQKAKVVQAQQKLQDNLSQGTKDMALYLRQLMDKIDAEKTMALEYRKAGLTHYAMVCLQHRKVMSAEIERLKQTFSDDYAKAVEMPATRAAQPLSAVITTTPEVEQTTEPEERLSSSSSEVVVTTTISAPQRKAEEERNDEVIAEDDEGPGE